MEISQDDPKRYYGGFHQMELLEVYSEQTWNPSGKVWAQHRPSGPRALLGKGIVIHSSVSYAI